MNKIFEGCNNFFLRMIQRIRLIKTSVQNKVDFQKFDNYLRNLVFESYISDQKVNFKIGERRNNWPTSQTKSSKHFLTGNTHLLIFFDLRKVFDTIWLNKILTNGDSQAASFSIVHFPFDVEHQYIKIKTYKMEFPRA